MTADNNNIKIKTSKKYWSYAVIVTAAAFVIALNIISNVADNKFDLSADVTKEQYSTLTEASKEAVGSLSKSIYIYYIGESEQQDILTTQLLRSYASASKKLHYSIIDKTDITKSIAEFKDVSERSVIVAGEDILSGAQPERYTILTYEDMYSGLGDYSGNNNFSDRVIFRGEQKITSAIEYVEGGALDRAVFLNSENEGKPCASLISDINGLFYKADFQASESPFDPSSDTLIVVSPEKDLSDSAYTNIKTFLESGGHAMFFLSCVNFNDATGEAGYPGELKNFNVLIADYGAELEPSVIIGGDPSKTYKFPGNIITFVSPQGAAKIAVDPNTRPVIQYAGPIESNDIKGVLFTPLLETDASCYSEPINIGLEGIKKKTAGESGPFTVGAVFQKENSTLALFTSSSFVVSEDAYSYQGNSKLFLNTLSYLGHRLKSVSIPAKTIYSFRDPSYRLINVPGALKVFLIILAVCVFPLIPLLIGLSRRVSRRKI